MFIPLRVQTCFSMLESTIEVKALAKEAAKRGFPAIGLADRGALFAAMIAGLNSPLVAEIRHKGLLFGVEWLVRQRVRAGHRHG